MIIFRNDDISKTTDLKQFKAVHALFNKYKVTHTIALICKDIEDNKQLVKYLKQQKNIDIQVHAWEHYDFTLEPVRLSEDLPKCVELITRLFKKPTILYPPWNKSDLRVAHIARQLGLEVSNKKISLSQYLEGKPGEVINFHSWDKECKDLEAALKKFTS